MIEIKLLIDDIDYEKAAETASSDDRGAYAEGKGAFSVLSGLFSMPGSIGCISAKAVLSRMSPESKDELIARCLIENSDRLVTMLEDAAAENGMSFRIKSADAKAVGEGIYK